jgi:hypothetical protein
MDLLPPLISFFGDFNIALPNHFRYRGRVMVGQANQSLHRPAQPGCRGNRGDGVFIDLMAGSEQLKWT